MCEAGVEEAAECVAASVGNDNQVEVVLFVELGKFFVAFALTYWYAHKVVLAEVIASIVAEAQQCFVGRAVAETPFFRYVYYCYGGFFSAVQAVERVDGEDIVLVEIAEIQYLFWLQRSG